MLSEFCVFVVRVEVRGHRWREAAPRDWASERGPGLRASHADRFGVLYLATYRISTGWRRSWPFCDVEDDGRDGPRAVIGAAGVWIDSDARSSYGDFVWLYGFLDGILLMK